MRVGELHAKPRGRASVGNIVRIRKQLPVYFMKTFVKTLFEGPPGRIGILAMEILGWLAGLQFLLRFGWRKRRIAMHAAATDAKGTAK